MVLEVSTHNNVKIYTVSGSASAQIPDWLQRKKRKTLQKDIEWRTRIELIQDFEFAEASNRIKVSRDGNYAIATGVYKPQMRVYDFAEMSLKFERHTDAENVQFQILSDDWTKTVHLQNDRSIEFHSQGGLHYKTRIPKFGRDIAYHYPSCDLMVAAASPEIYRLNLEQGRFLNPLKLETAGDLGVNVADICPAHQLCAFGTEAGTVEFWDPRYRSRVALLRPSPPSYENIDNLAVTALKFRDDGLSVAVGTSTGHSLLYDLRSPTPWLTKDQQYGLPIKSLHWYDDYSDGGKVISADKKVIKIWNQSDGQNFSSIEPNSDINDVCVVPQSGLLFVANEGIQMSTFYIPQLGPAPKWCSFLDNLTEELEENATETVYDDYKFVSRKDLASLGLSHLVGTSVLKPYMHGFFVDLRLYEKAKLIANPFAYQEHRERVIRDKVEKARESRIRTSKAQNLPKINKNLATRLLKGEEKRKKKLAEAGEAAPDSEDAGPDATGVFADSRFGDLFTNPEFEIDEESREYELRNAGSAVNKQRRTYAEEEDEDSSSHEKDSLESDSASNTSSDVDDHDEPIRSVAREAPLKTTKARQIQRPGPKMRSLASSQLQNLDAEAPATSFGERIRGDESHGEISQGERSQRAGRNKTANGTSQTGLEMTFNVPKRKRAGQPGRDGNSGSGPRDRRGVRKASKNILRGN